jgi:ketosteroid isomerase-like protein
LQARLHKHPFTQIRTAPVFEQFGDTVLATSPWVGAEGRQQDRFMVLTVRDGKIMNMRGFTSRRQAERCARRE